MSKNQLKPAKSSSESNNDACLNCQARGNLSKCMDAPCSQHESWFSKELMEKIHQLNSIAKDLCTSVKALR